MKPSKTLRHFTIKDGREVIIRDIRENELENVRQLFIQTLEEDQYPLNILREKHQEYPFFFMGCFNKEEIVGTVFGWPDPKDLVVKAIAVAKSYRRKGIGTALLRAFENVAIKEGFENFALGARWEAVPFYLSYGLDCFANIQIKPDEIPWKNIKRLRQKYDITGALVFGPSTPLTLVSRLYQELSVEVGMVDSSFKSVSIQIKPKTISKEALEEMKKDFNAYSTQFAFKKKLLSSCKEGTSD